MLGLRLGVFQRPLTLVLLQKYRDINGSRIVIQIGGEESINLPKHGDRNERCIGILFRSIGVRGRFDFPDLRCALGGALSFRWRPIHGTALLRP